MFFSNDIKKKNHYKYHYSSTIYNIPANTNTKVIINNYYHHSIVELVGKIVNISKIRKNNHHHSPIISPGLLE